MMKFALMRPLLYMLFITMLIHMPHIFGDAASDDEARGKTDKGKREKIEPLKIGNFALPASQQIGPLIAIGQNIVDKHDFQVFFSTNSDRAHNRDSTTVSISPLYGITDSFSYFATIPFFVENFQLPNSSTGMGDITAAQFEYAFYDKTTLTWEIQMTALTGLTLPTGSAFKVPPTGFSAPGFGLGATAMFQAQYWYCFISGGALMPTKRHIKRRTTQIGNRFVYQSGVELEFGNPFGSIIALMVEMDGVYMQKSKINGIITAGKENTIAITPSVWLSTKRFILQVGFEFLVAQPHSNFSDIFTFAGYVAWKF
ncbi:MAG: hypothetical protein WCE21_03125 [Candidatus Babeliales bacterium]